MKNVALALLASTILVPAVSAQDRADDSISSVYDRYREGFSAPGIRSGSFLFLPTLDTGLNFDSNIFATDADRVDDIAVVVTPGFALTSDWNNNFLSITGDVEIAQFFDNGDESYEDYNLAIDGRLDFSHGSSFTWGASFEDSHEDRGSIDQVGDATQTRYSSVKAFAGFKRDDGIVSFELKGAFEDRNFDDAIASGGGVINNDDRDRKLTSASVRFGYDLNDDYEAFVKLNTQAVKYDDRFDDNNVVRDSDGWDIVGGAAFHVGGKSEGEFYIGYLKRDYDSASLGDVSAFTFGASLLIDATGLTSVKFSLDRSVLESTTLSSNPVARFALLRPASGILDTRLAVRIEHELQRNLLLNARASYNNNDYINLGRVDVLTKFGVGAKYLLNRNFSLDFDYEYDRRETSDRVDADYKRHTFLVGLKAQW